MISTGSNQGVLRSWKNFHANLCVHFSTILQTARQVGLRKHSGSTKSEVVGVFYFEYRGQYDITHDWCILLENYARLLNIRIIVQHCLFVGKLPQNVPLVNKFYRIGL